jgi:hypothetical protein
MEDQEERAVVAEQVIQRAGMSGDGIALLEVGGRVA